MLDWMPEQASDWAENVDWINNFISYTAAFCTLAITAVVIYFAVRYRRKSDDQKTEYITHSFTLETIWTVIPTIVVIFVFYYGTKIYHETRNPPANALEISVEGYQWGWNFTYPNGKRSSRDLVVPIGRPTKLIMKSRDVNHSFFIPAMRIKEDLVASQYTYTWFTPTKLGDYHIFCTEYCGLQHSAMIGSLKVVAPEAFEDYLIDRSKEELPPAELGKKLYVSLGCNACHSLDGSKLVGPSFKGLYGASRDFTEGESSKADDNYLRESILNPNKRVVKGFVPAMPAFEGRLEDDELSGLIAFIKEVPNE